MGLPTEVNGNNSNSLPTEYAKVDFFKILYTNVDSLINKIDELKLLIRQEEPHLVAVTEILPKNSVYPVQEQELQIDGFNIVSVLFLLYINDLPNALEDNNIKLFADDAKLDNSITCNEDTVSLQRNLNNMVDWSEK